MFNVRGIGAFAPRLETGGPIVKDKLFLEQTAQFRYGTSDVPSRPEDELKTINWFSSFTRVDANMSPRHSLVATGGFFPSAATWATLGTFTPPEATVDIHSHVNHVGATERAIWSDTLFSETTVQIHESQNDVLPQGKLLMEVRPETTLGNFYNTQQRSTATYQIVETAYQSDYQDFDFQGQVGVVAMRCVPTTCAAQGKNCGSIPDGCGGTLSCGSCSGSQTCGGGGVARR